MTDERWQLAYAIYEAAAPLAEAERQQYVHTAAPDAEIAGKVLAILGRDGDYHRSGCFSRIRVFDGSYWPLRPPAACRTALRSAVLSSPVMSARGEWARVYSAHDPDLNREVALKVIAQEAETSSSERFIREAQAASALNHPNIVTVYEVIRSGPTVAIAMELVTGTSLRHFCGTAQPVEKVALWGRQIAHALAAAHAGGIVHRDIKPENLMLRPDGYIKVLDFGLARQAGAERADGELAAGTLGYMSPEEILRRPITAASDIFSLGVVLYELASGTNPFRGDSAGATTRLIEGLEAPPLPAQGKRCSPGTGPPCACHAQQIGGGSPDSFRSCVAPGSHRSAAHIRRRTIWVAAALAICALGGMAVWRVLPSHRADDKPILLQSLPLDSEPASETAPAFSPDGGSIVYASDLGSPGIHHIVTRSVAGVASGGAGSSQPLTLTSAPQDDTNPVWSPDGSRIAFLRRTSTEALEAIVIPAGGGAEHVIASLPGFRPGARKYLTWAPGGEALVAAHRLKAAFALRLYRFRFPVALNNRSPRDQMGHRMSPPLFPRMAGGSLIFVGRMAPHTSFGLFRSSLVERRSCWSRVRFRLPRLRGNPTAGPSCMAVAQ